MLEVLLFFIFAVIIGLMFTFFGYPFFRFLLPIWAFFAGLSFGFRGIEQIMGSGFISSSMGIILGIVLGVFLAVIAYMVYSLAVYMFGLTMGYVLGSGLMLALGFGQGFLTAVVGLFAAGGFAYLFAKTKMPRFIIIFLTASGGAMAVMMGIFVLFGKQPKIVSSLALTQYMVWGSWFWMLIWVVLAGLGMGFQYVISSIAEDLNKDYDWEKEYTEIKVASRKK